MIDLRKDALDRLLNDAPRDDEPTMPEEEAAVQEALEAAAGRDDHSCGASCGVRF